jgi:hypothetical protein
MSLTKLVSTWNLTRALSLGGATAIISTLLGLAACTSATSGGSPTGSVPGDGEDGGADAAVTKSDGGSTDGATAGGGCDAPVCTSAPCTASRVADLKIRTQSIAADGDDLFVLSYVQDSAGTIRSRPFRKIGPTGDVEILSPDLVYNSIGVSGGNVYGATLSVAGGGSFAQKIEERSLASVGSAKTLVDKQGLTWGVVSVAGGEVFFGASSASSSFDTSSLTAVGVGGGATRVLAKDQYHVVGLAADATDVVFSSGNDLMRVARAGGTPVKVLSTSQINDIALRNDDVFFVLANGGLHRIGKAGGADEKLVDGAIHGVAVKGDTIYFGDSTGVQCIRLAE